MSVSWDLRIYTQRDNMLGIFPITLSFEHRGERNKEERSEIKIICNYLQFVCNIYVQSTEIECQVSFNVKGNIVEF